MRMPRGDGTGPSGRGPMSGRGMGFCIKSFETGEASYIGGGVMRCYRRWFGGKCADIPLPSGADKDTLENEKEFLQRRLEFIEKELKKLE